MRRRELLKSAALTALAHTTRPFAALAQHTAPAATSPTFTTANTTWQHAYDRALAVLAANVQILPRFPGPVLIEGAEYAGIWQECGPHESLVYSLFRPDVARNTHMTFFALQHEDGQLPANNKRSETGFGQIQMVVPIAATAWELARNTARRRTPHHRLQILLALGRLAHALSQHARNRPHRRLLHLRHRHGQQPALGRHAAPMPRQRRAQMRRRPHPPAPLSRSLRHHLRRTHRTRRHGPTLSVKIPNPTNGSSALTQSATSSSRNSTSQKTPLSTTSTRKIISSKSTATSSRASAANTSPTSNSSRRCGRASSATRMPSGRRTLCPPPRSMTQPSSAPSRATPGEAHRKRSPHSAPAAGSITTTAPPSSPT